MTYQLAGFTFTFVQNDTGGVYQVITPPITVGPFMLFPPSILNFDPALTVEGAEGMVSGILQMLGIPV